jgi:hypothetical protein
MATVHSHSSWPWFTVIVHSHSSQPQFMATIHSHSSESQPWFTGRVDMGRVNTGRVDRGTIDEVRTDIGTLSISTHLFIFCLVFIFSTTLIHETNWDKDEQKTP